ncbi:phosphatase PAP2 family protein [Sphingomonas sp. BK345]|uniref:acid phosphatase n=1 Tax=Sphingomonas sp. BK345 TaxID=2586980 RepID=UPI001611B051|nr:phosphatase PAP2 family protein [Sphingomonas sp. BK345]MBB3474302.1 acid phosphatase (class A) [Sphingomonas sp. BK345]
MSRAHVLLGLTLSCLASLGVAASQQSRGFLVDGEFDVVPVLEPAPAKGDPRYETDRTIFRATRALKGSPRWQLATADADYSVPALMNDFSCAAGVQLTPQSAPELAALVQRAGADTGAQTGHAKEVFRRDRPFVIDRGPVCQAPAQLYDERAHHMSYDYPSGHTTWGWTWALVLTAAIPERAQEILTRGRAYGDSRFVCGAHNESAVEAGMQSASATMALVSTKPAYQAALGEVRAELAALRAGGAAPARDCAAEARLLEQRVMPRLPR